MPSALVAALTGPIREVRGLVGPGWSDEPATALGGARDALDDVSAASRLAWRHAQANWSGAGADAAAQFAAATVAATEALAARVEQLRATAQTAGLGRTVRSPRRRAGAVLGLSRGREGVTG
jgi:hypothetical protein